MKRSTKGLLKAALVCFVIGAAFGIAALCTGFRAADFRTAAEEGYFSLPGIIEDTLGADIGDKVGGLVSVGSTSGRSYNAEFSGVKKLDLETGVAECRIIPYDGETWEVKGSNLPSGFKCTQKGSELKIDSSVSWNFFGIGNKNAKLEIYIPKSQEVKKIKIDAGVGSLEVGDAFLKCQELEIDSGVGDCTIRADITKKLSIDGGVGDIKVILKGEEADFNYDVDSGLGNTDIGGSHGSGFGSDQKIDNGASKDIDLDIGVGSVTIDFEEE